MPVVHSPILSWMWDASSEVVPTKLYKYLVPVVTWKLRWSKRALVPLTITGFMTKIDLVGSGKYPHAGPILNNKLNTFSISSNFPPAAASLAYQGCRHVGIVNFSCKVSGSISLLYRIIARESPCVMISRLTNQWPS